MGLAHLLILRLYYLPAEFNENEKYLPVYDGGRRPDTNVWDQKLQKQL